MPEKNGIFSKRVSGALACTLALFFSVFFFINCNAQNLDIKIDHKDSRVSENIRLLLGDLDHSTNRAELGETIADAIEKGANVYGYYDPDYQWKIVKNELRILIKASEPVSVTRLDIQVLGGAQSLPEVENIIAKTAFKTGAALNHKDWENLKNDLLLALFDAGYLESHIVKSEIRVDVENLSAEATLSIDSNEQFYVGVISYSGTTLDTTLLEKLLPEKSGSIASRTHLMNLHKTLIDTQYFSGIEFQTQNSLDDKNRKVMNVQIMVKEQPSHLFEIGSGYGTDTGPRLRFNWLQPKTNNQGHSLENSLFLSPENIKLETSYKIPTPHPLNNFVRLGVKYENRQFDDSSSEKITTSLSQYRTLGRNWQQNLKMDFEHELYEAGNLATEKVSHWVPGASWQYRKLEKGRDPQSGLKLWFETAGSTRWLGSETDFMSLRSGVSWLYSFTPTQQLISRFELGAVITPDIDKVPVSKRFFTGGDQSVRGYAYESISPVDNSQQSIGGKYLNITSFEYSYRFKENWRISLFTDAGRAYNKQDEDIKHSIGTGLKWLSPVGHIKTDLAFPVNDATTDRWRLHFSIGLPL
ncbi:MAG: outer membrane protein assembly factor [Pseudomonadales bacterium]|nr:outer membrane protein assembly factor [Pseudomonadales bacterium]